eukprot:228195_1
MSKHSIDAKAKTTCISNSILKAYRRVLALGLSLNTYSWSQLQGIRMTFEPTNWLSKLKEGDKCDIYSPNSHTWNVATILKIDKLDTMNIDIKFYVHYNKWSLNHTEWILIKYKRRKCWKCGKYCARCFTIAIYIGTKLTYMCQKCASYSHYQYLFNLTKLLYDSMFRKQQIKIDIINMITNYSFSNVITCNNQISNCSNLISMNHAINIRNIKYNTSILTIISKIQHINTQHIICEKCCKDKQSQSKISKCSVFHDNLIYCKNGCDSLICDKCDVRKCATDGCSFNYYECCRKSGKFIEQCHKPTDWLSSLKVGDKFDILDNMIQPSRWTIATILNIDTSQNMNMIFHIHYCGWSIRYDEYISIKYETSLRHHMLPLITPVSGTKNRQLQPLHFNTPYHSPKEIDNCRWTNNSETHKCGNCNRQCCNKCFIVT